MGVGKRVGGYLYVHRTALACIDPAAADKARRAEQALSQTDWNVAKIGRSDVSLLLYQEFDTHAFPALMRSAKLDLDSGRISEIDYSDRTNPPILHRKELLIDGDDPRLPAFRAVTAMAEERGLFAKSNSIGTKEAWSKLLEGVGLRIDDPNLVAVPNVDKPAVARWKTAIVRPGLSSPVGSLIKAGVLAPGRTFFDYGCGHGGDIGILAENGFEAFGWDPTHRPDGKMGEADVVNLGFVVNVIEDPRERVQTLRKAWSYAKRAMSVGVMLTSRADVAGQRPHGDGYVTSRGTFQKYFTQGELIEWVAAALDVRPISIAPGVVVVFKDRDLEQETYYGRNSAAGYVIANIVVPIRERAPRRPTAVPVDIDAELDDLWQLALDLGRLPSAVEIPAGLRDGLTRKRMSVERALRQCVETFDVSALDMVARARMEDLIVHGALSLFPGAPAYSSLPASIQRDIRHFHGGAGALAATAAAELGKLRDPERLAEAFGEAVARGIANMLNGNLRFRSEAVAGLPYRLRILLGCADLVEAGFSQVDAVEVDSDPGILRGYVVNDMGSALPTLSEVVNVDLKKARSWRARVDDGVLYLKSTFMTADDPDLMRQVGIDKKLTGSGIVNSDGRGPKRSALASKLK
jgi:DNA phosphorothioation-associated putative methyltransferase